MTSIYSLPQTPLPSNSHPSATLEEQQQTEQLLSELLALTAPPLGPDQQQSQGSTAVTGTQLRKGEHVQYACSTLYRLPAPYVSLDASRPWLLFWTMHSLDLLGCGLDDETRKRCASFGLPQGSRRQS